MYCRKIYASFIICYALIWAQGIFMDHSDQAQKDQQPKDDIQKNTEE